MVLKAVIFGSIGTLTETSEIQRQAFNRAFADAGHDWRWDADAYRAMVSGDQAVVGGGDRIAQFAAARGVSLSATEIAALHNAKSRIFQNMMAQSGLPLNRGVHELLTGAKRAELQTVFASTTSRANIDAMLAATRPAVATMLDLVLSGEDAHAIKPAPDIYLVALERLNLAPSDVIAIEDSAPSMAAARAADIATLVVPGKLWVGGTFDGAVAVMPDLHGVTVETLDALVRDATLAA
jgi:HAD superfamily hydrolase (TIGR01509 family)